MLTYKEAIFYSRYNPNELVAFTDLYSTGLTRITGFLLNGNYEGTICYYYDNAVEQIDVYNYKHVYNSTSLHSEHTAFWPDGSTRWHHFKNNNITHGEYIRLNRNGDNIEHQFYSSDTHIEELDYLIDEERDETFYFTLSLYGIDKEYTFK